MAKYAPSLTIIVSVQNSHCLGPYQEFRSLSRKSTYWLDAIMRHGLCFVLWRGGGGVVYCVSQ